MKQIKQVIELGISSVGADARTIVRALAALAQENARLRVASASIAALTDNSGGTANTDDPFVIAAATLPTSTEADGVALMAPKDGFDTAIAAITAAHHELQTKVNEVIAAAASPRNAAGLTGTSDGTIAAITVALTGVADTTCVDAVTGLARLRTMVNNQAAITAAVNYARVALGLMPVTDNSGGTFETSASAFVTAAVAATGDAVDTGANSLPEVATETALGVLKDNIATLADAITELTGITGYNGGPFVVATSSARGRFRDADVDFSS